MPKRKFDPSAPYQGISGMARISGLSPGYIRDLCKKGECAYILCGKEYRINKELFFQQLEEKSRESLNSSTRKASTRDGARAEARERATFDSSCVVSHPSCYHIKQGSSSPWERGTK